MENIIPFNNSPNRFIDKETNLVFERDHNQIVILGEAFLRKWSSNEALGRFERSAYEIHLLSDKKQQFVREKGWALVNYLFDWKQINIQLYTKCPYKFNRGDHKGQLCGNPVDSGRIYCTTCQDKPRCPITYILPYEKNYYYDPHSCFVFVQPNTIIGYAPKLYRIIELRLARYPTVTPQPLTSKQIEFVHDSGWQYDSERLFPMIKEPGYD